MALAIAALTLSTAQAAVVAVPGNPLQDIALMKKVDFVMKAGTVYKQNGEPTAVVLKSRLGI